MKKSSAERSNRTRFRYKLPIACYRSYQISPAATAIVHASAIPTERDFVTVPADAGISDDAAGEGGAVPTNLAVKIPPELAKLDGIITEERIKTNPIIQYDNAYLGANLAKMKRLFSEKLR